MTDPPTGTLCIDGMHHPMCATAVIFITMPQCGEGPVGEVSVSAINLDPQRVKALLQRAIERWNAHMGKGG